VIVIIGSAALRGSGPAAAPDGLAADIARAAVGEGSAVELITKVGDDDAGDALMVALARAGVGHVATLRDPARATVVRTAGEDDSADAALDPAPSEAAGAAPATNRPADLAPVLEPADVALALRYVADFRVVLALHVTPEVLAEAIAAVSWAEAHLVVVQQPGSGVPEGIGSEALVVEAAEPTDADPADGTGAGALLGRYAAAVDRGDDRSVAYLAMTSAAVAPGG
jgi:sugar/nucleoside kinase (ribokinase family)